MLITGYVDIKSHWMGRYYLPNDIEYGMLCLFINRLHDAFKIYEITSILNKIEFKTLDEFVLYMKHYYEPCVKIMLVAL